MTTSNLPLPTHPTLRDPRTGDPLRALGWGRRGIIWPVIGGAPDDPPADPANPPADPANPPADPPKDPADTGGKGSKEAVLADLANERKERQALQARLEKLKPLEKLAEALGGGDTDKGKTELEAITARQDALEKQLATARLAAVSAKVEATASNWHDPADAVLQLGGAEALAKYLDQTTGAVNTAQIAADLAKVLETKAYLAKPAGAGGQPGRPGRDPGQGAGNGDTGSSVKTGRDLYAERHPKKSTS